MADADGERKLGLTAASHCREKENLTYKVSRDPVSQDRTLAGIPFADVACSSPHEFPPDPDQSSRLHQNVRLEQFYTWLMSRSKANFTSRQNGAGRRQPLALGSIDIPQKHAAQLRDDSYLFL